MTPALPHTGREAPREIRFALAAAVCAAVLAGLLGMVGLWSAPLHGARQEAAASRTHAVSRMPSPSKLGWEVAGLLHGSHVAAPRTGSRDQVDGGGAGVRPPTPFAPRLDTLRAILARHDARMLAHAEGLLARALPSRLTPLADRPRTVNCPAQGPPVWG
ncbi:hypothetical protein COCOR_03985 [Corallococcus coralloides DSM 2259]|uniref:Uncharacterized protein n=1 Tax=Corallococcus coralloides (strain ATCC 25202 / DSM 2259 / NBRC 100086 / M2) TaxID=1144275 RepID=H8MU74_CORCM|nr:hypothetical protein [Corallococcus coralloides]AFE05547.1 hypothetical protein COCOR_03985 [Corallococcus coralloides DSM 2259]